MTDDNQRNVEKCQGRRNAVALATPQWLSSEHREQIKLMYKAAKELSQLGDTVYHVDHISPLSHAGSCGLHVPWNLQILSSDDNKKKGNAHHTEPLSGAILLEHLASQTLRYKGKFVKGYSGNISGKTTKPGSSAPVGDAEFELFMEDYRDSDIDHETMLENMSIWLIRNSRSREEATKLLKEFAPYFKPKLSNVDSTEAKDNTFTIKIIEEKDHEGE